MIKRTILVLLFCLMLLSENSAAGTILLFGEYQGNKLSVEFENDITIGDNSSFIVKKYSDFEKVTEAQAFRQNVNEIVMYVEGLEAGKKYSLLCKNVFLDGRFVSEYSVDVIVQLTPDNPDVKMTKARILDDKTFELYFNHPVDGDIIAQEALYLYEGDEVISSPASSIIALVEDEERMYRLVCKRTDEIPFLNNQEYSIRIYKGTAMLDGAVLEKEYTEVYMYKQNDLLVPRILEASLLRDDVIKIVFSQEMTSTFMPALKKHNGERILVTDRSWLLDENERQTILILYLKNQSDTSSYLIEDVHQLYSKKPFAGILSITSKKPPLEITEVEIQDASNIMLTLNEVLTDEGIEDLSIKWMDKESPRIVAMSPNEKTDNTSVMHVGLGLNAVVRNESRWIRLSGVYQDVYGVEHKIDIKQKMKFSFIPQYHIGVKEAYFADRRNIFLIMSHPVSDAIDKTQFKVTERVGTNRRSVGIEKIEMINKFVIRLQLYNGSNQNDVHVDLNDIVIYMETMHIDEVVTVKRKPF